MPGGIRGSHPRRRGASGKPGGGLARREPGSGAGMESGSGVSPGSGVRPGGSPVRTSGAEGTQLGDRGGARCGGGCGAQLGGPAPREPGWGAGAGGAQRLPGTPGQQAPLGLPGAHSPGCPPPAGQQGAAERGRTQHHPGSPRGRSLDRPR